jgi:siroheme synthase
VVPGVSAVLAAPAAARVPITHRGESRGFSVRTGHTRDGYTRAELPKSEETVVILMGLGGAKEIMASLAADGYPPDTPAVAVSNATRASQSVVTGTVATLADRIAASGMTAPATLIVGRVARRARDQASGAKEEVAA